jgi:hypothetical protein
MEEFEQRFVIKFLFIKDLRSKAIHSRLDAALAAVARSLTQVEEWIGRFKTGDSSCQDHCCTGRPSSDLAEALCNLLKEFPFAPSKFLAGRLVASKVTMARVLRNDLGLREYARQ